MSPTLGIASIAAAMVGRAVWLIANPRTTQPVEPFDDTDHTELQLLTAPLGAIYIWRSMDHTLPRQLAFTLNRLDITIVSCTHAGAYIRGQEMQGEYVIDHGVDYRVHARLRGMIAGGRAARRVKVL